MDIVGEYEYRYDRQLRSWADGRDTQKRPPILYCLRVCVSTGTKHLSKPDGSRQTTTGADGGEEHSNSIPIEEQRQPADDRGTPTHHHPAADTTCEQRRPRRGQVISLLPIGGIGVAIMPRSPPHRAAGVGRSAARAWAPPVPGMWRARQERHAITCAINSSLRRPRRPRPGRASAAAAQDTARERKACTRIITGAAAIVYPTRSDHGGMTIHC